MRIAFIASFYNNFILNAGQGAQLSLDNNAVCMRVFNNLLGQSNVLLKRLGRSVDHNRGEAAVDTALANFKGITVIQMESNRDIRAVLNRSLNHLDQIIVVRISARALGYLQHNRSLLILASLGDTLDDFHVVYVESADCIAAVVCFLKHFGSSY